MIGLFAADDGPVVHIAPGGLFHLGGFTITNSIVYGWACIVFMLVLLIVLANRITVKPKGGLMQFIEVGAEFITNTVESGFEDKARAKKYVPYFVTLFFF